MKPSDSQRVIDELSQQYAFVVRGTNLPLLKQIATTHAMPQENAEQVAASDACSSDGSSWRTATGTSGTTSIRWFGGQPSSALSTPGSRRVSRLRRRADAQELLRILALAEGFILIPVEVTGPDAGRNLVGTVSGADASNRWATTNGRSSWPGCSTRGHRRPRGDGHRWRRGAPD